MTSCISLTDLLASAKDLNITTEVSNCEEFENSTVSVEPPKSVLCAVLQHTRGFYMDDLVENYLRSAEERCNADLSEVKRKHAEEVRHRDNRPTPYLFPVSLSSSAAVSNSRKVGTNFESQTSSAAKQQNSFLGKNSRFAFDVLTHFIM